MDNNAQIRWLRAIEDCPHARDRALALLPFYAGLRIGDAAELAGHARLDTLRIYSHPTDYRPQPQKMSAAELDLVASQLLQIVGTLPWEEAEARARTIGERLNREGGFALMVAKAEEADALSLSVGMSPILREIEMTWDGIGTWRG
ncbi:hypothetical protein [Actinomadura sp. 6N118]|uniref:hypothetical protein n=1 Tax=Actinomadura sp. 6N118 TaxID=3375151 RepID=UPI0037AF7690